jgi:DNA-binding transcriptional MerR regulator
VTSAARDERLLGIGEVLSALQPEFADITISKIRFLESEGIVVPARTPSGYRKFTLADVERLRYALTAQRDHYLPLRVIRQHLDALDRGLEPPAIGVNAPRPPRALVSVDGLPGAAEFAADTTPVRMSRAELLEASGLEDEVLTEVEGYGLVSRTGRYYDADALRIASVIARAAEFGIGPRHLRSFKVAADREVGLVAAVVAPVAGQKTPQAAERADELVRELAAWSVSLHAALVHAGVNRELRR